MKSARILLVAAAVIGLSVWLAASGYLPTAFGRGFDFTARQLESVPKSATYGERTVRLTTQGSGSETANPYGSQPDVFLTSADFDQAVFDDLTVGDGEVIDGNVVVYDGDARVMDGGRIQGDLLVFNGDIRIDEGGSVAGDVSTFSGNVRIAGEVGGNVATWNGDIDLRNSAEVSGDVSVLNGEVERAHGASVEGNVMRGPRLELPPVASVPFDFGESGAAVANSVADAQPGLVQRFFSLVLRMIGMLLLAIVLGIIVWLIAQIRPSIVHGTRRTMVEQPALSFVVGILANVVLLLTGAFFAITICLIPLTFVVYMLVIALNVLGWAAISSVVSRRVVERYELGIRWDYALGITAAVMAAALGLFWAMGGCFRIFGFAGMLIVSSVGAGALLLPFIHRQMGAHPASQLAEESSATAEARSQVVVSPQSAEPTSDQVESQELTAEAGEAPEPDDFLQIRGIGPVSSERLDAAGVTTFEALSSMSAEEIGSILGWSTERVQNNEIIGQARSLAANS